MKKVTRGGSTFLAAADDVIDTFYYQEALDKVKEVRRTFPQAQILEFGRYYAIALEA